MNGRGTRKENSSKHDRPSHGRHFAPGFVRPRVVFFLLVFAVLLLGAYRLKKNATGLSGGLSAFVKRATPPFRHFTHDVLKKHILKNADVNVIHTADGKEPKQGGFLDLAAREKNVKMLRQQIVKAAMDLYEMRQALRDVKRNQTWWFLDMASLTTVQHIKIDIHDKLREMEGLEDRASLQINSLKPYVSGARRVFMLTTEITWRLYELTTIPVSLIAFNWVSLSAFSLLSLGAPFFIFLWAVMYAVSAQLLPVFMSLVLLRFLYDFPAIFIWYNPYLMEFCIAYAFVLGATVYLLRRIYTVYSRMADELGAYSLDDYVPMPPIGGKQFSDDEENAEAPQMPSRHGGESGRVQRLWHAVKTKLAWVTQRHPHRAHSD